MEDKSKPTIVTLKTDSGDVLGFYMGEAEATETNEHGMILFRPILIETVTRFFNGKPIYSYDTVPYFEFGSQQVIFPYSKILHSDIASDFFSLFFVKNIGELMAKQEMINDAYLNFYETQMLNEAMKETDSIYVKLEVEYMQ